MNDIRGNGFHEMERIYDALSGLLRYVASFTQGVALGWSITPPRGLGTRRDSDQGVYNGPYLSGPCNVRITEKACIRASPTGRS